MSTFTDKLRLYGADAKGALERFMGDEQLYVSCLEQFSVDKSFAGLAEALSRKDYRLAFNHAHSLKGVAGNLGLTPLYNSLSGIVESLRHSEYDGLESQYESVLAEKDKFKSLL